MNQIKIILCFLLISITGYKCLYGQEKEKKNSISLCGTAAQYFGILDFGPPTSRESYKFPVSPGAEIIYWREISQSVELGIGLSYQKVHHQSHLDNDAIGYFSAYKFHYEEVSMSILLKKNFPSNNQNHCYMTLGAYNGKQLDFDVKSPTSVDWTSRDHTSVGGYSKDDIFTDFYVDAGYALQFGSSGDISFAPFYKYRVNPTWVNTYLRKSIVGINLNYSFKF